MGWWSRLTSLYRYTPPADEESESEDEPQDEPALEPLPKLSWGEFWPPSPRVRILYIGLVFFLIQGCLLCVWAYAMYQSNR